MRSGAKAVLFGALVLAACSESSEPSDPYGVYVLTRANGHAVPAVVIDTNLVFAHYTDTWNSGTLSFQESGTWSTIIEQTITANTSNQTIVDTSGGTWTLTSGTYTLHDTKSPDQVITAKRSGSELTVSTFVPGFDKKLVAVFRK
ncbi:MAG TPA: hypothetical protein VE967_10035 [Gemmatimonadaceae bacterium]|nr:hypothetical protein [Gemmatimonadaceae bacterium]